MKNCKLCNSEKNEIEFGKDKQKKDGLNQYCKDCIKIRSKKQRINNPEYCKKYSKEYCEKNREILRIKARDLYRSNPEKHLESGRKSYEKHKDIIAKKRKIKRSTLEAREKEAIRQKKWRLENPDLYRSYIKKWQKKNKEKHAIHQRVHRAVKNRILIRSEKCQKCGTVCKTEGHHEDYTKPLNVLWLCRKCHGSLLESIEV